MKDCEMRERRKVLSCNGVNLRNGRLGKRRRKRVLYSKTISINHEAQK